jgi:hypothetical protein
MLTYFERIYKNSLMAKKSKINLWANLSLIKIWITNRKIFYVDKKNLSKILLRKEKN